MILKAPFWFIRFYSVLIISILYYFGIGFLSLLFKPKETVIDWAAKNWGTLVLKGAGIRLHVSGGEYLKKTPAIFVSNHQSMLDFFIMCQMRPSKTTAVAKKSLFRIPILGWFMKIANIIFIDRFHKERAAEAMEQARHIVEKGYSILIAPEGTRTRTGELQPLKKGAFHLALQTHLSMIPITIVNAYDLFPRHAFFPRPGTIDIFIDPPIETTSWTEQTLPQAIDQVRTIFLSHLEKRVSRSI